jgi:serine phosphatase RsbU (regulator of sigma subunit)
MTCFAMIIDPHEGVVRFANAGHVHPFTVTVDEEGQLGPLGVLAARGNPLGDVKVMFGEGEHRLRPGELFFLMTDGVNERRASDGSMFGYRRLYRLLRAHRMASTGDGLVNLRDHIIGSVNDFAGACPLDDDLMVVLCRHEPLTNEAVAKAS